MADSYYDFAKKITDWMDKIFGYDTRKIMFVKDGKLIEYVDGPDE